MEVRFEEYDIVTIREIGIRNCNGCDTQMLINWIIDRGKYWHVGGFTAYGNDVKHGNAR